MLLKCGVEVAIQHQKHGEVMQVCVTIDRTGGTRKDLRARVRDSKLIVATSVPLVLQGVGVELFIYKPDHEPQPKYRSIGDAH
jgi:hypothetical protein